jgi:uncharacterized protein YbjT (DUF2867 family)
MTSVVVTGGTGVLGRQVTAALLDGGHHVRVASRRPRPVADRGSYEWAVVDFRTGAGLADAVLGVDAVVHCASATRPRAGAGVDDDMTRFLVGVLPRGTHLVYISIVGIEAVPIGYYRHKLAAEEVVSQSGLGWTILRTTQFHSLLRMAFGVLARVPIVMPVPSGIPLQPIAEAEVGARLAELAVGEPAGRVPDLGGPEIRDLAGLAGDFLSATHRRRRIAEIPLRGKMIGSVRAGSLLAPDNRGGRQTFASYLATLPDR